MNANEMITFARERLTNEKQTQELVVAFIQLQVEQQLANSESEEFNEIYKFALETNYPESVRKIFQFAESESEKRFLSSLLISFLISDPLGFVIISPHQNAELAVQQHRQRLRQMLNVEAKIKNRLSSIESKDFTSHLDFLLNEREIGKEAYQLAKDEYIFYHVLGFYDAFFLMPQAKFPNIKVAESSIRADAYIYIPSNEKFNLIVECDGYQFHSNKKSFISDRKRDRVLRSCGYDVLRFSGTEIYNDPVSISIELFDYLQKVSGNESGG